MDWISVDRFLQGATFESGFFTDVFLGLSYKDGCAPAFHFAVSDSSGTLTLQPYLFFARYDVYASAAPMIEVYPSKDSMIQLILKHASASRSTGELSDDDYDVLCEDEVVGRITKATAAPVGTPWMWSLGYGHHEDRSPIYGYEATREAAMTAFAKSGNSPALPLARPYSAKSCFSFPSRGEQAPSFLPTLFPAANSGKIAARNRT